MAAKLVQSLRCPVCGQLPDVVLHPEQVFCGNNDCSALMFSMTDERSPARQVETSHTIDLSPLNTFAPVIDVLAGGQLVRDEPPEPDSLQEAAREGETRAFLHAQGWRCAGDCPVCDPWLPLRPGQRQLADQLLMHHLTTAVGATPDPPASDGGFFDQLYALPMHEQVAVLLGRPGLRYVTEKLGEASRLLRGIRDGDQ